MRRALVLKGAIISLLTGLMGQVRGGSAARHWIPKNGVNLQAPSQPFKPTVSRGLFVCELPHFVGLRKLAVVADRLDASFGGC